MRVVVGVDVDEAGREHPAVGIELELAALVDAANLGDVSIAHRNIGGVRREPATVDDRRAAHDEIGWSHARARAATRSSMP